MTEGSASPVRVAFLASGAGSNVGALLEGRGREQGPREGRNPEAAHSRRGPKNPPSQPAPEGASGSGDVPPWEPVLLVSDRPGAGALEVAEGAGVPTRLLPGGGDPGALEEVLEGAGVDLVVLAGYLRLVPEGVVARWRNRILNIHPSLLPAFGGKGMFGRRVHEAVLASGARVSGATVHLVNERFDEGRIVAQWPVPVLAGDDASALAARILAVEHRLYPLAVAWVCRALRDDPRAEPPPLDLDSAAPGSPFAWSGLTFP